MHVLTVARTPSGTLALSGPMVPHAPFPPGAERGSAPRLKIAEGSIDTFYPCRVDRETQDVHRRCARPPVWSASAATASRLRAAQDLIAGIEDGSTLAALPDMLAGHRLAGAGADRDAICDALLRAGANPLAGRGVPPETATPAHRLAVMRPGKLSGAPLTRHLRAPR